LGLGCVGGDRVASRATIVVAGTAITDARHDDDDHRRGRPRPSAGSASTRTREANALENTLHTKGVKKKDMQTSDLSISQNYDQHGNITGYSVSNMVTVTLHDLDRGDGSTARPRATTSRSTARCRSTHERSSATRRTP
jgi:hypothetical protein